MTDCGVCPKPDARREELARLAQTEDRLVSALLVAKGTTSEGAVASALAALLQEYSDSVTGLMGDLALAGHEAKAGGGSKGDGG